LLAIWNARWASIIATIASAESVLEVSSEPPATVVCFAAVAGPLVAETAKVLLLIGSSWPGDLTSTILSLPTTAPFAETVPSEAIERSWSTTPAGSLI